MLLFLVKFSHSLVIIYLLICLYCLWEYALVGLYARWIGLIIGSILLEAIVFALAGFNCPFTDWAIALGDSTGTDYLSEVLYLERINYVENYAIFAALGMLLAGRRYFRERSYLAETKAGKQLGKLRQNDYENKANSPQ